jgi:hypothetical protein
MAAPREAELEDLFGNRPAFDGVQRHPYPLGFEEFCHAQMQKTTLVWKLKERFFGRDLIFLALLGHWFQATCKFY